MDKVLSYTLKEEDLEKTAGGLVNLILKNCVGVTGHEISAAKFLPDGITADGKLAHVSERIQVGQTLRVLLPEGGAEEGKMVPVEAPADCPLSFLYEDDDLVILNKPAGVVVHPSPGHYMDTMANYLAYHYAQQGQATVCRIIGRLDKETSGTLVFAKNRASAARLSRQRAREAMSRTYLAVVEGAFPSGVDGVWHRLEGDIENVPGVLMKRQVTEIGTGSRAVTRYQVLAEGEITLRESRSAGKADSPISPGGRFAENSVETGQENTLNKELTEMVNNNSGNCYAGNMGNDMPDQQAQLEVLGDPRNSLCVKQKISLVACRIETGRTHQIRVHMASEGHPLIGDTIYGSNAVLPDGEHVKSMAEGDERALLHAVSVEMIQPFTGEMIHVDAKIPEDFATIFGEAGWTEDVARL